MPKKPMMVGVSGVASLKRNAQPGSQFPHHKRFKMSSSTSLFPLSGPSNSPNYRLSPTMQTYMFEELAIDGWLQNDIKIFLINIVFDIERSLKNSDRGLKIRKVFI